MRPVSVGASDAHISMIPPTTTTVTTRRGYWSADTIPPTFYPCWSGATDYIPAMELTLTNLSAPYDGNVGTITAEVSY